MTGPGKDKPDAPDDRSFAELVSEIDGVVPIPSRPSVPRKPSRAAREPTPAKATSRQPLQRPDTDDPFIAHASSVRGKRLRELKAGKIRPDSTLDLHGLDRRQARKLVHDGIRQASLAGERCVLVVAGRGHHSPGGVSVLRDELPDWLSDRALDGIVAAFAPAITPDGGQGALYVLLA